MVGLLQQHWVQTKVTTSPITTLNRQKFSSRKGLFTLGSFVSDSVMTQLRWLNVQNQSPRKRKKKKIWWVFSQVEDFSSFLARKPASAALCNSHTLWAPGATASKASCSAPQIFTPLPEVSSQNWHLQDQPKAFRPFYKGLTMRSSVSIPADVLYLLAKLFPFPWELPAPFTWGE